MTFAVARDDRVRAEVEGVLAAPPERPYLDLSPATFIDATGCRELVRAAKGGASAVVPVELIAPKGNWRVRRVVDDMQFGELLPVHDEAPFA
jgi:hypothetical protein